MEPTIKNVMHNDSRKSETDGFYCDIDAQVLWSFVHLYISHVANIKSLCVFTSVFNCHICLLALKISGLTTSVKTLEVMLYQI